MRHSQRQRIAGIITTVICALILWRILDRMLVLMWVRVPWWGFIIMIALLFMVVDHVVSKVLR